MLYTINKIMLCRKKKNRERFVGPEFLSLLLETILNGWLTEMLAPQSHVFTSLNELCVTYCVHSACMQTLCGETDVVMEMWWNKKQQHFMLSDILTSSYFACSSLHCLKRKAKTREFHKLRKKKKSTTRAKYSPKVRWQERIFHCSWNLALKALLLF